MRSEHPSFEYRPVLLSRRSELISWGLSFLVGLAWLILFLSGRPVHRAVPVLGALLLFSALSISLGNWMDRRTVLRMDEDGLAFQNGLRDVRMSWQEIQEAVVRPSGWGKKVEVIGEKSHFQFRTLGEVKVQGDLKGRIGFVEGEEILRKIIQNSGLQRVKRSEKGYYYARQ